MIDNRTCATCGKPKDTKQHQDAMDLGFHPFTPVSEEPKHEPCGYFCSGSLRGGMNER